MSESFPLKELRTLLNKAKAVDKYCYQFGAKSHQYQWNPPASVEEVEEFEQKIGVRLPEEYRDFLLLAGNGGAGPYYGLFSLQKILYWLEDDIDFKKEPVLYPGIEIPQEYYEDEDEDKYKYKYEDEDEELDDEEYDCAHMIDDEEQENDSETEGEDYLQGCIPIGSQGDSYFMYLLLSGPNEGRVVYVESELTYVFFPREQGFLAWYKRWLREVSGGYHIFWFGTNLDGDEDELRERYQNTTDKEEKRLILSSMEKFPVLSAASKAWIVEAAQEYIHESNTRWLLGFLPTKELDAFLEQRWALGLYDGIIWEIYDVRNRYRGSEEETWAFLDHWGKRIMKVLPQISQEHWYIAFEMFKKRPWLKLRDVAGLLDIVGEKEKPTLLRTFGTFPDAVANLDVFLKELEERENLELLNAALLAVPVVKDETLLAALERVCEELDEELRRSYDLVFRNARAMAEHVRDEFINPQLLGIMRPRRIFLQIDDEINLKVNEKHETGGIAVHPFIALVIQECFGGLPATPQEWDQTLLEIKTLILEIKNWHLCVDDSTHWTYIVPPDKNIPLKKPYYYALGDWSLIGRMQNLERLVIEHLCIEDFSFLAECKNVETLSLCNTNFSDCRLLLKLPKLKKVDLSLCRLEHEDALETLQSLGIEIER